MATWGFLTNHAHVLIQIARNPRSTGREIALAAGITERAAISVLHDMRLAGVVSTRREGRQNINQLDMAALAQHRPWGISSMEIPQALIDATLRGLSHVAANGACLTGNGAAQDPPQAGRRWGFLTTQALILIHVTQHPRSTVRETALAVGITERATLAALQDLSAFDIIERQRDGRRNSYSVNFGRLAVFRREDANSDLVPDPFVSALVDALLTLRPAV
ncbi:MAG: hypothetical protein IIB21_00085 [Chloroflexi bacterium]|nr:hypothetical protein [Chloroflexota bacterium]